MDQSFERFVGIDWSGAARTSGQQIYVAEAHRHGGRITLHSVIRARDRAAVEDFLRGGPLEPPPTWEGWPGPTDLSGRSAHLVGLDFAFGFPAAFRHPDRAEGWEWRDLGHLADLLDGDGASSVRERVCADPLLADQFRVERGSPAQMHMRLTDEALANAEPGTWMRPESVFNLVGPSQVGIGSITGIAMLHRLRAAERIAVWPFDDEPRLDAARVVLAEIYPRMWLDRGIRKNELPERVRQLEAWEHKGIVYRSRAEQAALSSGDALDAAAAAIGLARSAPSLPAPAVLPTESRAHEGWIVGVQVPAVADASASAVVGLESRGDGRATRESRPGGGAPQQAADPARTEPSERPQPATRP